MSFLSQGAATAAKLPSARYFECSAKTCDGTEKLLEFIVDTAVDKKIIFEKKLTRLRMESVMERGAKKMEQRLKKASQGLGALQHKK